MCADAVIQSPFAGSFTQHVLRENNFVCVRYWLNELTGRKIEEFERFTIQSRLAPTANRQGFANVNQYIEFLGSQTMDFTLPCWQELLDAVLETESWFRREARHFNFLQQIVLPSLPSDARLLSAGCGAGEEAFDIAFECARSFGTESRWHVDAVDIRQEAIALAQTASWLIEDCTAIPEHFLADYFKPQALSSRFAAGSSHILQVTPELQRKVSFSCRNLLHSGAQNQYHVIFCRNLIMDMEKRSGQDLINNLFQALKPGGYLIVSHNENLLEFVSPESLLSPHVARKA